MCCNPIPRLTPIKYTIEHNVVLEIIIYSDAVYVYIIIYVQWDDGISIESTKPYLLTMCHRQMFERELRIYVFQKQMFVPSR